MGYVVGGVGGHVTDNLEDDKVVIRGFVLTDHVPVLPMPLLSFANDQEGRRRRGGKGRHCHWVPWPHVHYWGQPAEGKGEGHHCCC
jgi:hypothetical protein